jgi:hypothetical protein
MTLLISWIAVDTHGPTSVYMASDSRISWGSNDHFDYGRKVFALKKYPDILGYCGDVLFPSIVLGQIAEMADQGLLFAPDASCKEKFEAIKGKLIQLFQTYPSMVKSITADTLQVLHASRDPSNNMKFFCDLIEWRRSNGWAWQKVDIPTSSGPLLSLGSGSSEFTTNLKRYTSGPNKGTSRNIFHCFCDTLFNIQNVYCGGAPQLVGIYRKPHTPAITFGIIRNSRRYYLGARIDDLQNFESVEWRNDLFELFGGRTMKRQQDAQKQPDKLRRT